MKNKTLKFALIPKRLIDLVIGATNNYKWKGTSYNTYQTSTPWINSLATNELVDWTNVDKAEQLFADILDPGTGEPVLVRGTTVLVMPAYRYAAHRVFTATELKFTAAGSWPRLEEYSASMAMFGIATKNGAAVLMARIVDNHGVCVRREQVAAIGCSIHELDEHEAGKRKRVQGFGHALLDVDEVFFDSLEIGGLWDVDVVGYNFRHVIRRNADEPFLKLGARYEIRYVFVPKQGESVIIRFFVRLVSR